MATPSMALITSGTKELGSTLTISMNPESTSYTHTLTYEWSGRTGTIGTGLGASTTWTPSLVNMAPYLTTGRSATCTLTCVTYNGSIVVGTRQSVFTLSVPNNSTTKPSLTTTVSDTNGYYDTYGGYIDRKSNVNVTLSATAKYGATIAKYQARAGSGSYKTQTGSGTFSLGTITFDSSGSDTVQITTVVTDSRGFATYDYKSIPIYTYEYPSLSGTTLERWNTTSDQPDNESSTVRINLVSSIHNVGNKNINKATITIKYKLSSQSSSNWVTYDTLSNIGTSYSDTIYISGLSAEESYDFWIYSVDSIHGASELYRTVDKAGPVIDLKYDGTGIAFLTVSSEPGVTVGGDLFLYPKNDMGEGGAAVISSWDTFLESYTDRLIFENAGKLVLPTFVETQGTLYSSGASEFWSTATFNRYTIIPSITATMATTQELTATNTLVPMTAVRSNRGSNCFSLSGGGVKCVYAGFVKISYTAQIGNLNVDARQNVGMDLYINDVKQSFGGLIDSSNSTVGHVSCTVGPLMFNVTAGSIITIQVRSTGGGGYIDRAYLTVSY